jgi:hypothetical protein
MKKFIPLVLLVSGALASCGPGPILADEDHLYFAVGNFNGWGGALEVLDEEENFTYEMEAISVSDSRVSSIKSKFNNPEFLYVLRIVLPSTVADWSATYTRTNGGTAQVFNGNLTLKIIQADVVDVGEEAIPNWYAQGPESGVVNNITPETLYIPPFLEEAPWTGSGAWNDNPVALTAGTYTAVFGSQIFEGDTLPELFLGLVSVTA